MADRCNVKIRTKQCNDCYDVVVLKFFVSLVLLVFCKLVVEINRAIEAGFNGEFTIPILTTLGLDGGSCEGVGPFGIEYSTWAIIAPIAANLCDNILCAFFKTDTVEGGVAYLNRSVSDLCDNEVRMCLCKLLGLLEIVLAVVSDAVVPCPELLA